MLSLLVGTPQTTRAADEKDKQIQELRERLDRLEKELGVKKEAAPAPAPAPTEAPQSIGDRVKTLEETIKSTPLFSVVKDWTFGGHVAVSYNYNFNNPNSGVNAFRVFDEKANQFTIHQAELWIDKPTTTESPIGFGVDVVLGRDAKKIHAFGLGGSEEVFDLTQAYVTYKAPIGNGLDLKAGKFVTLHGAEVIRRTGDYQISRSLAFNFAIPFTHTGIMASYSFNSLLSLTAGIVNGWDNADDNNNDKSFHGMATITPIKDLSVTLGGTWGPEQRFAGDTRNGPKRGLLDLVASYKPIAPLTLTLNYDYAEQDEAFADGGATARWHAIAAYATYEITDKFSVGARGEYFRDEDGFRLGFDPNTGKPIDLWEITLTARYKLLDHLFASVEFRHDEATDGAKVFDDGDGVKNAGSQDTIAFELVYQF